MRIVFFTTKIVITELVLLASLASNAQNQVALTSEGRKWFYNSGDYYFDDMNWLPPFAGVWNGQDPLGNQLTIDIQFLSNYPSASGFTHDCLIGSYNYNPVIGPAVVSSITPGADAVLQPMYALYAKDDANYPQCPSCASNEVRLFLEVLHPNDPGVQRSYYGRLSNNGGQDILTIIPYTGTNMSMDPNAPASTPLPFTEFVLYRQ